MLSPHLGLGDPERGGFVLRSGKEEVVERVRGRGGGTDCVYMFWPPPILF